MKDTEEGQTNYCQICEKRARRSSVEEFADTISENPKKIIAWAKREIKEYEKLIKILEKRK